MMARAAILAALLLTMPATAKNWQAATPGAITQASGYVDIADAAIRRDPAHAYRALFDATAGVATPDKLQPTLSRMGFVINGLMLGKVPAGNIRLAAIFHGPSVDALLNDEAYRAKHKINNPNLPLIAELKKAGVRLLVCGQYMAQTDLPRSALIPAAEVAEGATIVLITMQNDGYALIQ